MPKDYAVLKDGTRDYKYDFYEREHAEKYAERGADENPGGVYEVVEILTTYTSGRGK